MRTLILGATTNESRYAYLAAERLTNNNHEIVPVGIKTGKVFGKEIINSKEIQSDIHTITLYVGTKNQEEWIDYILETNPKRIIFNPGTENAFMASKAIEKEIETVEGCTLVMLAAGAY